MITSMLVAAVAISAGASQVTTWQFDKPSDAQDWVANDQLTDVAVRDGALHARAIKDDPYFMCDGVSIKATPWQFVLIRIKADRAGRGELFWTGNTQGKNGGLSGKKSAQFYVPGDNAWHDIAVFPFWQNAKVIRKLRLDVYNNAQFDIASIRVMAWGTTSNPDTGVYEWNLEKPGAWRVNTKVPERFAPPLQLPLKGRGWITVQASAEKACRASVLWGTADTVGAQREDILLKGDGATHVYNIEMQGNASWKDNLAALGMKFPPDAGVAVRSIALGAKPSGGPDLVLDYLGWENGVNRPGKPCKVLAHFRNYGGTATSPTTAQLTLGNGLRFAGTEAKQHVPAVAFDEYADVEWIVTPQASGAHTITLACDGMKKPTASATLNIDPPLTLSKAKYVPTPHPIKTTADVCAFYFPGWNLASKWDCIRATAPIRKPLLGYYDEGNPECVDWQIKWATENGISCFLLDWYWDQGSQTLTHWIKAYRKARYRDDLKLALMWANHNPPGSNSTKDWRNVTQYWIDHVFNLPTYFRIDGKPAVFIWAPVNLRNDLGSGAAARAALDESRAMARKAGYQGITFVAMGFGLSTEFVEHRLQEGYDAFVTYHEWGNAGDQARDSRALQYADVVATAPQVWAKKNVQAGKLTYYPTADTGWDARPWHGNNSMVIAGRTPELFGKLLREARTFCDAHGKKIVVLGPMNEWGEGSYIEPCTQYGFHMYEQVRAVFGKGSPDTWPVNVAPSDVGLGPYDFPLNAGKTAWTFDHGPDGWTAMMNITGFHAANGALRMKSVTDDPAILADVPNFNAAQYPTLEIRMQLHGKISAKDKGQVFWVSDSHPTSEAASVRFPLATDGRPHDYRLNLAANSYWRGIISSLRFDPCAEKDIRVTIDGIKLLK